MNQNLSFRIQCYALWWLKVGILLGKCYLLHFDIKKNTETGQLRISISWAPSFYTFTRFKLCCGIQKKDITCKLWTINVPFQVQCRVHRGPAAQATCWYQVSRHRPRSRRRPDERWTGRGGSWDQAAWSKGGCGGVQQGGGPVPVVRSWPCLTGAPWSHHAYSSPIKWRGSGALYTCQYQQETSLTKIWPFNNMSLYCSTST